MLRNLRLIIQHLEPVYNINCRLLSTNETAAALRPFIFAVHPDLFGQYPKERQANEESLKRLNEYLEGLHQNKKPTPVSVLFYLRSTEDTNLVANSRRHFTETFRAVRISLLAESPRDVVKAVLRSCNLSLDYVDAIKPKARPPPVQASDRPIRWSAGFRAAYGMPEDPMQTTRTPKPLNTLRSWLDRNVSKARTKQAEHDPILAETERLKASVLADFGLQDVRWQHKWGLGEYRASLGRLSKLISDHSSELELQGRVIVFANERGVCCKGHVVLPADDVSENWLKVLRSIRKRDQILYKLPSAERYLSALLNDIQVLRRIDPPVILAEDYLLQLRTLTMTLKDYLAANPGALRHERLNDLQLVVECASGPLMLSPSGKILVPVSCPAFLVVDFLNAEAEAARHIQSQAFTWRSKQDNDVIKCQEKLGLRRLARDENITPQQVSSCCERLSRDSQRLSLSLRDLCLKVAMFYSVMSDGEVCIPWNYVDDDD